MYMSLKRKKKKMASIETYSAYVEVHAAIYSMSGQSATGCLTHTIVRTDGNIIARLPFSVDSFLLCKREHLREVFFKNLTLKGSGGKTIYTLSDGGRAKLFVPLVGQPHDVTSFLKLALRIPIEFALYNGSQYRGSLQLGYLHETMLMHLAAM